MNFGRFSLNNGVLINIALIAMLILGIGSLSRLPREAYSDISFSWAFIVVPYPGVSAEDIEKSITVKIENELADLDKVDKITSVSNEGAAFIQVAFDDGISDAEFRRLFEDLRTEVDKVELPEDALDPIIEEFTTADFMPIVKVNICGDASQERINEISRDIKERLERVANISKVELVGGQEREVWVEADRARLEAFGISLDEIAGAIKARHLNVPAGVVETEGGNYVLRTIGEIADREDFGKVIVRSVPGGGVVQVSDVAKIGSGLAKSEYDVRYNGKQAISLFISKNSKGNSIQVVDATKKIIDEFRAKYKGEVSFDISGDTTIQIRDIMKNLGSNALFGILCVVLVLYFFLGFRNSLAIAIGIPMTFAITFVLMYYTGNTLNSNTLFALVMVLGMIVDHAIVMIENIYRYRQNGVEIRNAAEIGTNEVVWPVISSAATTIAAFLPLILLPGIMGKFMRIIPIVVCMTLAISIFVALFYIPQFVTVLRSKVRENHPLLDKMQSRFSRMIRSIYRHRYITLTLSFLVVVIGFIGLGKAKMELFGAEALSQFTIDIKLPRGSGRDVTNRVAAKFEKQLLPLLGTKEYVAVNTTVGFMTTETDWITEDNVAQINVLLKERSEGRTRSVADIMDEVRKKCNGIAGAEEVKFQMIKDGPPVDKPVSVKILGKDLSMMEKVSSILQAKLTTYEGIYNITDNFEDNSPELRVRVNERLAGMYGLSVAQIGMYLRGGIDGIKAATYFDEDDEIDVIVKFDQNSKNRVEQFRTFKFPAPNGSFIPFSAICALDEDNGVANIRRYNRSREITVTADATDKMVAQQLMAKSSAGARKTSSKQKSIESIQSYFNREIAEKYPGVTLDMEGEFAEFNRLIADVMSLLFIGVFAIYMILGAQFKSYIQPLIILFTVPFALVGVVVYLLISGTPLSIIVMYALVALVGVSVNASIVLISFINHRRRVEGMSVEDAVVDAAVVRMRPIMLTTFTTMMGLVPMALGIGGKSEIWGPMASTMVVGLLVGVIGTFTVIPCVYGMIDDISGKFGFKMKLEGE